MLSSKSWIDEASGVRPNTSPARAEAIARGVLELAVGHHLGAAGGVVGGDDLDAGQRAQKPLALRQRLRMRVDAAQAVAASRPAAPAGDARPAARPRRRSAARARAAGRSCGGCCRQSSSRSAGRRRRPSRPRPASNTSSKLRQAHQLRVGDDPPSGRLAEGARLSLICDVHGRLDPRQGRGQSAEPCTVTPRSARCPPINKKAITRLSDDGPGSPTVRLTSS